MILDQIGNIGEFVGALAVVISLVYLSVQLRHSTRTVRAATHQSIVTAAAACNATIATNKDLARIFRIGSDDPTALDEDERVQFTFLCSQFFDIFENLYLQRSYETLDDDFWLPRTHAYLDLFQMPGVLYFWQQRQQDYARSFAVWVEEERVRHDHENSRKRLFMANDPV